MAVRTKYLRIAFYQPHIEETSNVTFESILKRFQHEIPGDEGRTWESRADEPLRLQTATKAHSYWTGDMMRIRMGEELRKGRRDGTIEEIVFDSDEGLGENTAFLYHAGTNTLVIHEHRGGVSLSMFAGYFARFGEVEEIELRPLIKPDAIERAAGLSSIKTFEFHLAGVNDAVGYRKQNAAARAVLEMMGRFDAPKAKITLETGIKRGTPNPPSLSNAVISVLRGWLNQGDAHQPDVEKLVVTGFEGDDVRNEAVINLLEDRLVELLPVSLKDGERITDAKRVAAVIEAWNTHGGSIRKVYGSNG